MHWPTPPDALPRLARDAAAEDKRDPRAMVRIAEAARTAGTSIRVVREAIRGGALVAYGRPRDRSVRRDDLDAWIASRRLRPVAGVEDRDIEARIGRSRQDVRRDLPASVERPAA